MTLLAGVIGSRLTLICTDVLPTCRDAPFILHGQ
jgi:hypothetical protein